MNHQKKQLASKEKELKLQNRAVQEQVDSLMQEFETIKKQRSNLAGQEKQAQAEAFSAMVQEAEERLAEATASKEARTEEHKKIVETVQKLRQRKGLLTDIAEADHKISLIQLVKDNLDGATSKNPQDQEVINEIIRDLTGNRLFIEKKIF